MLQVSGGKSFWCQRFLESKVSGLKAFGAQKDVNNASGLKGFWCK